MPTREQVWAALALGNDYVRLAHEWGIPAGRLYLIANGRPPDCSDGRDGRTQVLVNPREVNPTARGDVRRWMKRRAYADAAMRGQG